MLDKEVYLEAGNRQIRLYPSLGRLVAMERQTGKSLGELAAGKVDVPTLRRMVSALACGAVLITDEELLRQKDIIAAFLHEAIGGGEDTPSLNWHEMFMTYVGMMNRPVSEFWQITLTEYALALEGFCLSHNIDLTATTAPATSQDLAVMLERFPDGKLSKDR